MPLMEHLRELRNRLIKGVLGILLGLLGGFFAYLAMGRGLHFLLGLTPNGVLPFITIDTYFGFVMAFLLIFGIAFELPLVLVLLNLAGVVRHSFIRKYRRVMIFLVFV